MKNLKLLALVLLLLTASDQALAWMRGSAATPRPFALNIGTGAGVSTATYPFLNLVKACGSFTSTAGYAFPLILNYDGYPTSTPTNNLDCSITTGPWADNPPMVASFQGMGAVAFLLPTGTTTINSDPSSCVVSNVSGLLTLGGTNCTVGFTMDRAPSGSLGVRLPNSGTYSNMSNLVLVRADQKSLLDAGGKFGTDFKTAVKSYIGNSPDSYIRFMDWSQTAGNDNKSLWAYRGTESKITWAGTRWEPTVFGATPITGTNSYVGPSTAASPINPTDGQVYQNLIQNANTSAAPTLQLCDPGPVCGPAIPIVTIYSNALATSGSNGTGFNTRINANVMGTFVYKAKKNVWMYQEGAIQARVPYEVQAALCNELSTGCWIHIPTLFTQASSQSFGSWARDNVSGKVLIELGNEFFLAIQQPYQYASTLGTTIGFPTVDKSGYGLLHRQAMGSFTDGWSPRSTSSLVRYLEWIVGGMGTTLPSGSELKLDASGNYCSGSGCTIVTRYDSVGSCSASNTTSGRPIDCTDAIGIAPYYNGAIFNFGAWTNDSTDGFTAVNDWLSGVPAQMQAALDFVDCDVRGVPTVAYPNCGKKNGNLGANTLAALSATIFPAWEATAATYDKPLIWYENAYQAAAPSASSLVGLTNVSTCAGGSTTACAAGIASLIAAYKNDARFKQLVRDQISAAFAVSPHMSTPSWYFFPPGEPFGIYSGSDIYSTPYQSGPAINDYVAGN